MKSRILVFIQFLAIFLMLLPIGSKTSEYASFGLMVIFIGVSVGVLALSKNKLGNFNIRPNIKENCSLITTGIYSYIRHPMYTSVLVSMFGVMLLYINIFEIVIFFILLLNMLVKMFYEESLWLCTSQEYKEYTKNTKRLIPYIF